MRKTRYWRVDVVRENGLHAPSIYVETEESRLWKAMAEAEAKAKERTRLSDFPQTWGFYPVLLNRVLINGKWVRPNEEEAE